LFKAAVGGGVFQVNGDNCCLLRLSFLALAVAVLISSSDGRKVFPSVEVEDAMLREDIRRCDDQD
jgi:hypothetical protein